MAADDNLRDLFNEVAPPPEPSSEQEARARAHLRAAFRAAGKPFRRWWQQPAAAAAAAAVVAVVVAGVLTLPSSTPPVDANLANIARAARTVDVLELPQGAYVYSRTESLIVNYEPPPYGPGVFYLLPETTDVWTRDNSELSQRVAGSPRFFNPADEAAYYAAGQDVIDMIGEVRTTSLSDIPNNSTLRGLSNDMMVLREQIFAALSADPEWTPENEAAIVNHIANLLNPRLNAPPQLRAALIEIVGTLDVTTKPTDQGHTVAVLDFQSELGAERLELEFDAAGYLVVYRTTLVEPGPGIDEPGGLSSELRYSRPSVVAAAGEFPDG